MATTAISKFLRHAPAAAFVSLSLFFLLLFPTLFSPDLSFSISHALSNSIEHQNHPGPNVIRIAHITDFHLDDHYSQNAQSGDMCHEHPFYLKNRRESVANKAVPSLVQRRPAPSDTCMHAKWGRLGSNCDSPLRLVSLATRFLGRRELDIDYVLWTGDSARHDRDSQLARNEFEVFDANRRCALLLAHALRPPTTMNDHPEFSIKIFPNVGNLDVVPHNLLRPPNETTHLSQLARSLIPVLPPTSNEGISFAANGSFHSVLAGGRLHILSLNTMYWFKENVWANGDCDVMDSPGSQLIRWADATFAKIAKTSVWDSKTNTRVQPKVIILGHVPPATGSGGNRGINFGDELPPILPSNYNDACHLSFLQLLERYSSMIVSMHSGHINEDSTLFAARLPFQNGTSTLAMIDAGDFAHLAESMPDNSPLNTIELLVPIYTAPSVIPVYNPGVRVHEYDLSTGEFTGWTQYYLDLDLATRRDNNQSDMHAPELPTSYGYQKAGGESGLDRYNEVDESKKKKKHRHRNDRSRPIPLPEPIGDGPAVFIKEYSTATSYLMPSLSLHHWREAMMGMMKPYKFGVWKGGDGDRQGVARNFRQKYNYFFTVQGPFDTNDS